MKLSASRKLAALMLCGSLFGSGMTARAEEANDPSTSDTSIFSTFTFKAKTDRNETTQQEDPRIHAQQITLFDQEGKAVKIYTDGTNESGITSANGFDEFTDDKGILESILVGGEAAATKRAVITGEKDGKNGIVELKFQMLGKPNQGQAPVNALFVIDQSSSMNMYLKDDKGVYTDVNNMSCLNPNHYYMAVEETFGKEQNIPCLINIHEFNTSGPTWSSWSEKFNSDGVDTQFLSYRWASDIVESVKQALKDYKADFESGTYNLSKPDSLDGSASLGSDSADQKNEAFKAEGTSREDQQTEETGTGGSGKDTPESQSLKDDQAESQAKLELLSAEASSETKQEIQTMEKGSETGELSGNQNQAGESLVNFLGDAAEVASNTVSQLSDGGESDNKNYEIVENDDGDDVLVVHNIFNRSEAEKYELVPVRIDDEPYTNLDNKAKELMRNHYYFDENVATWIKPEENKSSRHLNSSAQGRSPDRASQCVDRAYLTKEYLKTYLSEFLAEDSHNKAGIILFSKDTPAQWTCEFTENYEDLLPLLECLDGGSMTNYEAAFEKANEIVDAFNENESVHTVFITDGLPNDSIDPEYNFNAVDPAYGNTYEQEGAIAAKKLRDNLKNASLYVLGLSLDLNAYLKSLASESRMATSCMTMDEFRGTLTEIDAEIQEGSPTNVELYDMIGGGFELLIDPTHPLRIGDLVGDTASTEEQQEDNHTNEKDPLDDTGIFFSKESLPSTLKITYGDPSSTGATTKNTSISLKMRKLNDTGKTLSFYVKAVDDSLKETEDVHIYPTNRTAFLKYYSGAEDPGEFSDHANTELLKPSEEQQEANPKTVISWQKEVKDRTVVRAMTSPYLEVKNSRIMARKTVNVKEGTVKMGDMLEYTITLKNSGKVTLDQLLISDVLNDGLEYVPYSEDTQKPGTEPENESNKWFSTFKEDEHDGLSWVLNNVGSQTTHVLTFQAKVKEDENQNSLYTIPNKASFGTKDGTTLETNTVTVEVEPYKEPAKEDEDPTAPEAPDESRDKPISANSAPSNVSSTITPAGSTTTDRGTAANAAPTQSSSVVPAGTSTLTTRYAASPVATAFQSHPVLWLGVMSIAAGALLLVTGARKKRRPNNIPKI